jgi:glycosyltransferase involved in cell wall biosynthesis
MPEISKPVFSIITPTFLRPSLLMRTINSVINQTFTDYEHIIIDDANDEETRNIVTGFNDKRIIFHQHTTPRGAAGAYNSGIKLSGGEYLLFLDDDDEYLPTFLEKMYLCFSNSGKNAGFVWTGISVIQDSYDGEKLLFSKVWPEKFSAKEDGLIAATTIGNGYGLCVRKSCVDVTGLYDESITMGHDADFLFRLAGRFEFQTIPEILVKIHHHGSSQLTAERNNFTRLELREKILEKHLGMLKLFPRLYYAHYKNVVDLSYSLKLKRKGRRMILEIIKYTPFRFLNFIDLIFYELTGADTISFYFRSRLRNFVQFLKGEK